MVNWIRLLWPALEFLLSLVVFKEFPFSRWLHSVAEIELLVESSMFDFAVMWNTALEESFSWFTHYSSWLFVAFLGIQEVGLHCAAMLTSESFRKLLASTLNPWIFILKFYCRVFFCQCVKPRAYSEISDMGEASNNSLAWIYPAWISRPGFPHLSGFKENCVFTAKAINYLSLHT